MVYASHIPAHPQRETWDHDACFDRTKPFHDVRAYRHDVYPLLGMHDHTFYEVNVILRGEGRHYIGERSCPARAGTVFVLPPLVPHGYASPEELVVFHILLSAAFMQRYTELLTAMDGYTLLFEVEPLLRGEYPQELFPQLPEEELQALIPMLDALAANSIPTDAHTGVLCHGLALQILATLCAHTARLAPYHTLKAAADLPILRSMEYIHAHCGEPLSPTVLAKEAGMAYATYLRHFTRVSGQTPHAYLTACRMTRARQLLRHTSMTVLQVALECGFYDSAHFIRTFRQQEGISPSEYAKTPGR